MKNGTTDQENGSGSSHILEALRPLCVAVDSLTYDPENMRTHDLENMQAVKDSFARFGQRLPIVVQQQGMVVRAGNARLKAAREMGWNEIAAVVVDESDVEATAFALVDNRSSELAAWDSELGDFLLQLEKDGEDVESLGWSREDLDAFMEKGAEEEAEPEIKFSEYIGESNHYIVLKFESDIDWLQAQSVFNLETVTSRRANGKPWSSGIGRVLDGPKAIARLTGAE